MNLQKGQKLESGFTIIDIADLAEMKAAGIWARHDKSGAEVFHVLNGDSENLFAFAFATTPEDNTGASHILEHSVLCGSERYPLKEPFMTLAQGSLQTYLNAWTFPDKTVYPASSVNEHDYFNLMSVYGDAVFRPLLSEWTFMQEAHRHEFAEDGRLSITGVVYNEMKGAYSSLNTYAGLWSVKSILPDTPYGFESGGDPDHIPELTWEGLKEYHRRRYSPANCRIFLAGNIPTEKQLAFLNERFFAGAEAGKAAPPVAKQQRWDAPKKIRVPCPAGGDAKPTVFLSWLLGDITDSGETIALSALSEILLGHDGSPLTRALVESGLGEDITPVSGFESEIAETLFAAGLRGAGCAAEQVEALILNELKRLAAEGIPKEEIEAALLSMEFSQREVKRSGGPFSLVWMCRALRGWLHGMKPWESLLVNPMLAGLKQRIAEDGRFFESLIRRYLLDNPHRALVVIEPQEGFLSQKEARLAQTLEAKRRDFSEEEKRRVIDMSAALEEIQSASDSPEALAAIPHLSRGDLSPEPELIPRSLEDLRGIPALCHDLYTNGVSYFDLAFPVDNLSPEDYLWLPFFSRAALAVGLQGRPGHPGMDYAEVSSLMARTVGGFHAMLHTGSAATADSAIATPSGDLDLAGRDWIIYRLKCLDEKTAPSLDLALRMINEADFSDQRRIRDLVLEMKNDMRSSLAPNGHMYASGRAGRSLSPAKQTGEIWNGITQLLFVRRLAETDIAEITAKLRSLREAVAAGGLIASLAGSAEALKSGGSLLAQRFGSFGPPQGRRDQGSGIGDRGSGNWKLETGNWKLGELAAAEVFASPSLQIGFASIALRAAPFDTLPQVAETVLAHQLSTGALWEDIRMKGGAYGAFATSNSLERCFSLATYRDPAPLRSLDIFSAALKTGAADLAAQGDLDKMIIGCYSRETRPQSPSEKDFSDFIRFLSRADDGCRRRRLERLIAISEQDIAAALENLARQNPAGTVVIAGRKDAEQAAKALGAQVQELPA